MIYNYADIPLKLHKFLSLFTLPSNATYFMLMCVIMVFDLIIIFYSGNLVFEIGNKTNCIFPVYTT